jgi:hypothetical protein
MSRCKSTIRRAKKPEKPISIKAMREALDNKIADQKRKMPRLEFGKHESRS